MNDRFLSDFYTKGKGQIEHMSAGNPAAAYREDLTNKAIC